MNLFPNSESASNFSDDKIQQTFVQQTQNSKELIQKELDVNLAEQNLLEKRIDMMNQFINEIPASDPQYSILATQVKMDQIELNELKLRVSLLKEKLSQKKIN